MGNVSVRTDELTKLQQTYEARINKQRERLTLMLEFLEERELVDEFNDWENKRGK